MTEVTFQFSRQSDLELMLQMAQRLGIPYQHSAFHIQQTVLKIAKSKKPQQLKAFEAMEKVQTTLQKHEIAPSIDLSQMANEVNALAL
jgi:hypothetical protein